MCNSTAVKRRVVTRLSSEELVAAKSTVKRRRVATKNDIELVPAAKRRVVTRSSEMKPSNQKCALVKSLETQPSSQETSPGRTVKRRRLLVVSSNKRIFTGTVRRRRIVERTSETLPSNEELFPVSNQMEDRVDASHSSMVSNKLSKSIPDDFETYKRLFLKWTTTIVKENVLYNSTCNCPALGTEYICEHIVGLGIRMKLVTPPPEAKTIPIGEKRKPGRPAKTKPALMIQ